MKRLATILFALLFLGAAFMPGSQVKEFYKIPFIFEHYQTHQQEVDESIGFGEFLTIHFSQCNHSHRLNKSSHDQLPFHGSKTQQSTPDNFYLFSMIMHFDSELQFIPFNWYDQYLVHPSDVRKAIFHPPVA